MKRLSNIAIVMVFSILPLISSAQDIPSDSLQINQVQKQSKYNDLDISPKEKINQALLLIAEHTRSVNYYKLYPTTNIWTFIKLNTCTGQLWQVQYSTKGNDYRFQTSINSEDLTYGIETATDRFELYPTQNTYNFLLLDKLTGRIWQVQWSMEAKERIILRIY
jgi:hypothetical protein